MTTLQDILPPNTFRGVGLILPKDGRFLYGIRPVKWKDGYPVLEITGIGGKIEQSDSSMSEGALREAMEEIGVDVRLLACSRTLLVEGPGKQHWLELRGDERPAVIITGYDRRYPHKSWLSPDPKTGWVVNFLAELITAPRPSQEIPYIIMLTPQQILDTAQADLRLGDLLNQGSDLFSGPNIPPDENISIRLTDSQEALALALGNETLSFYSSLLSAAYQ
jgi:8-oxo-dGTP pyrophosphatase MutT (NUDIX family)